ncbi:hypothetical protein [Priestia endophytica]|jgi:uncharacterized transporter YbjL|uniref:hypothetical protein n=1 Tax=Priestia endophytica TaxID=135735 RepID=UPI000F53F473|nr:hypothetical protein [Priestia endophytica]MED4071831.1 hypothetical protein [Priestia endophytica]RPK06160.1 hypothetical protein FH5_01707 [Priestia endophytica]
MASPQNYNKFIIIFNIIIFVFAVLLTVANIVNYQNTDNGLAFIILSILIVVASAARIYKLFKKTK